MPLGEAAPLIARPVGRPTLEILNVDSNTNDTDVDQSKRRISFRTSGVAAGQSETREHGDRAKYGRTTATTGGSRKGLDRPRSRTGLRLAMDGMDEADAAVAFATRELVSFDSLRESSWCFGGPSCLSLTSILAIQIHLCVLFVMFDIVALSVSHTPSRL
jgi:hypothetical protein